MSSEHACADCRRTDVVLVRADGLEPPWLCLACAQRRVNAPEAREVMQAEEDLNEHLDGGGKLS